MVGWIVGRSETGWARPTIWSGFALLILAPLVAMQFTSEVDWGGEDFVAAALILGSVAIGYEISVRVARTKTIRRAAIAGIVALGALVWANAAVGIF